MEQDTHTVLDPPASELPDWPGQRLREAREALNLSRTDVARKLRLDPDLIQALEDNNTKAHIWSVFVGQMSAYLTVADMLKIIYEYGDLDEAEKRLR